MSNTSSPAAGAAPGPLLGGAGAAASGLAKAAVLPDPVAVAAPPGPAAVAALNANDP